MKTKLLFAPITLGLALSGSALAFTITTDKPNPKATPPQNNYKPAPQAQGPRLVPNGPGVARTFDGQDVYIKYHNYHENIYRTAPKDPRANQQNPYSYLYPYILNGLNILVPTGRKGKHHKGPWGKKP